MKIGPISFQGIFGVRIGDRIFTCAARFWAARLEVDSSRFPLPRLPSFDDVASGWSMSMDVCCASAIECPAMSRACWMPVYILLVFV